MRNTQNFIKVKYIFKIYIQPQTINTQTLKHQATHATFPHEHTWDGE